MEKTGGRKSRDTFPLSVFEYGLKFTEIFTFFENSAEIDPPGVSFSVRKKNILFD